MYCAPWLIGGPSFLEKLFHFVLPLHQQLVLLPLTLDLAINLQGNAVVQVVELCVRPPVDL